MNRAERSVAETLRQISACAQGDGIGCSIHGRAPLICRTFDCRDFYRSHTRQERRAMMAHSPQTKLTLSAGRERLDTLT